MKEKLSKIRMIFGIENWLFDSLPLFQNSKFNNFLLVSWFLGKNLSNFVSPIWKLHNPYFHNVKYVWSFSKQAQHFVVAYYYNNRDWNSFYFGSIGQCAVTIKGHPQIPRFIIMEPRIKHKLHSFSAIEKSKSRVTNHSGFCNCFPTQPKLNIQFKWS